MNRVRNLTCDQFRKYLEEYPASLPIWQQSGQGGMPMAIAGVDWRAARADADTPKQHSDHQNATGIVASWTLQHMARSPIPDTRTRSGQPPSSIGT